MHPFLYQRPETVPEALDLLGSYGPDARLLAGGTDLLVGLRKGKQAPRVVVDIKRLGDLQPGIDEIDGVIRVAAPTTLRDVICDLRIRAGLPSLVEAARVVGSVQIRNRATLAGNVCNASPAADTAPPLLAFGAQVVMVSNKGRRQLPLRDFMVGPQDTALQPGEMVSAIEIPLPAPSTGSSFARLTRRRGVDLAIVSVSCVVTGGIATFAFAAVGPRPFVITDDSVVLTNPDADPAARRSRLAAIIAHARPISDIRGSREYRQAMVMTLAERALRTAIDRRDQYDGGV